MGGLLSDVWFVNNVIWDNHGPGLVVADWGGKDAPPPGQRHPLRQQHRLPQRPGRRLGRGMHFENAEARDVVVRNNILSRNAPGQIVVIGGKRPQSWTLDHNLLDGPGTDYGTDDVHGDPGFVNPAAGDFHLRRGSPAIARGSAEGAPTRDRDGRAPPGRPPRPGRLPAP